MFTLFEARVAAHLNCLVGDLESSPYAVVAAHVQIDARENAQSPRLPPHILRRFPVALQYGEAFSGKGGTYFMLYRPPQAIMAV